MQDKWPLGSLHSVPVLLFQLRCCMLPILFDSFMLLLSINSHLASGQPTIIMIHYHLWVKLVARNSPCIVFENNPNFLPYLRGVGCGSGLTIMNK